MILFLFRYDIHHILKQIMQLTESFKDQCQRVCIVFSSECDDIFISSTLQDLWHARKQKQRNQNKNTRYVGYIKLVYCLTTDRLSDHVNIIE